MGRAQPSVLASEAALITKRCSERRGLWRVVSYPDRGLVWWVGLVDWLASVVD